MGLRVVETLDEKKWLDFVNSHPHGNIFHTPCMSRVYKGTEGYEPVFLAVIDNESQDVLSLLLSVCIRITGKFPARFTSRAVVYGGILYKDEEIGEKSVTELIKTYDRMYRSRLLFTEIRNINDASFLRPFLEKCGYEYEEHLNYLIDLERKPDDIFQSFYRTKRRDIRTSIKRGTSVEEISQQNEIAISYKIIKGTYSRARIPLADISLFENAFAELADRNMIKCFLARYGNDYIGTMIVLLYKGVIYAWYGGSNRDFKSFYPTEAIAWHIMKWGAENGYHTFDWGGAGRPNEQYTVRDFKSRFGGTLVNYGRYYKVYSPLALKISKAGYWFYRKIMR